MPSLRARGNGHELEPRRFHLNRRRKFFDVRVLNPWSCCGWPALWGEWDWGSFQPYQAWVLGFLSPAGLCDPGQAPVGAPSLTRGILRGFFQPLPCWHSGIQWAAVFVVKEIAFFLGSISTSTLVESRHRAAAAWVLPYVHTHSWILLSRNSLQLQTIPKFPLAFRIPCLGFSCGLHAISDMKWGNCYLNLILFAHKRDSQQTTF